MNEEALIKDIGNDLVAHSQNYGCEEMRSMTELLFPSIFTASKRMSARAISRWLQENHSVKFSAASVSKALRNQEHHFKQIAERVQPIAEHIANSLGLDLVELLTGKTPPPDVLVDHEDFAAVDADHYVDLRALVFKSVKELEDEWFSLDPEIRVRALGYFELTVPDEGGGDDE